MHFAAICLIEMRGACRDTVPLLLLRVGLVCSAAGPLWQLPAPSTELCSKVLFHASGVEVALQRYPQLKVAVSLDGEFLDVPNPLGHLRTDTLAASEPGVPSAAQNAAPWFTINVKNGLHAVSLELVNRTTHGLHFVVYQHLIAFTTSASPACRTCLTERCSGRAILTAWHASPPSCSERQEQERS